MSNILGFERTKFYLLYNVDISNLLEQEKLTSQGITKEEIAKLRAQGFTVRKKQVAGFFTKHYREDHTPFEIDLNKPMETFVDVNVLKQLPFFENYLSF